MQVLKNTAGNYAGIKKYNTGAITDVVYGVEGGMEDWGYGVGFENDLEVKDKYKDRYVKPIRFNCRENKVDKLDENR